MRRTGGVLVRQPEGKRLLARLVISQKIILEWIFRTWD
jgi:hypothetical protein